MDVKYGLFLQWKNINYKLLKTKCSRKYLNLCEKFRISHKKNCGLHRSCNTVKIVTFRMT